MDDETALARPSALLPVTEREDEGVQFKEVCTEAQGDDSDAQGSLPDSSGVRRVVRHVQSSTRRCHTWLF